MAASFSESCFCMISGASRGLGREMAIQFTKEWKKSSAKSHIVLMGRDKTELEETERLVKMEFDEISVSLLLADLGDLETITSSCDKMVETFDSTRYKQVFLIHNAGTLGDISHPIHQQNDPGPLTYMTTLHITSMWLMTAKVISITEDTPSSLFILNISSLLGTMAMAGLGSYSFTRSARNMFMKTLSLEMSGNGNFRGFTYTPGPCDTGMYDVLTRDVCFKTSQEMLKGMTLLQPSESITKLIKIIKDNKYENGSIIDYLDYE